MSTLSLFDFSPRFDGPGLNDADNKRLGKQLELVKALMLDGRWRTPDEVIKQACCSPAGVTARLRDLRKEKFGGFHVERRRREGTFVYEYKVTRRDGR